jgi:ppGpp synthetase/RelA/SpoT-type nucleotidyltranferase
LSSFVRSHHAYVHVIEIHRQVRSPLAKFKGCTVIFNSLESYDFDAIEEDIVIKQSTQQDGTVIRIDANKSQKKRRKSGKRSSLPNKSEGSANRKTGRSKGLGRVANQVLKQKNEDNASLPLMPSWLARYEEEDFSVTSYYRGDELQQQSMGIIKDDSLSLQIQRLRLALKGIYNQNSSTDFSPPYFTECEIDDVCDAMRVASQGNSNLMAGCAEFVYLMLMLEEEGKLTNNEVMQSNSISYEPLSIMTRDMLIAAIFHYCDCVRARKAGVYDYARKAMEASLDSMNRPEQRLLLLPVARETDGEGSEYGVVGPAMAATKRTLKNDRKTTIDHYGEESVRIAAGAARLKRAEIMASIVNPSGSLISRGINSQTNDDAAILRSFLVSISEDWRGLVIRSAACLYRLKKISGNSPNGSVILCKTNMGVARDAFKVYAPLAQRLGMQRLKTELENSAFRVLYPRQFNMASSLYSGDIDEMKTIVQVLSSRIEQLLKSDDVFLRQIEDVSVTSRVKEPYSLWKKMVRIRKEVADAKNKANDVQSEQDAPSLKWIPDVIALRVVLSALRLSPMEDDESLRTREKMLCYYVLQLISDVWPASNRNRAKDYIQYPKKNGYQSLHYTASLMIAGDEWPFEVQIRSQAMHRVSEFGVAAHWDYKLQNKATISLPDTPLYLGNITAIDDLNSEETIHLVEIEDMNATLTMTSSSRDVNKSRISSYIDALTSSREMIIQNNLFIFISSTKSALDGRIVSINPSESKVADVLKKFGARVCSDGNNPELYINGVTVSLNKTLCNGDVLTLPHIMIDDMTF